MFMTLAYPFHRFNGLLGQSDMDKPTSLVAAPPRLAQNPELRPPAGWFAPVSSAVRPTQNPELRTQNSEPRTQNALREPRGVPGIRTWEQVGCGVPGIQHRIESDALSLECNLRLYAVQDYEVFYWQ